MIPWRNMALLLAVTVALSGLGGAWSYTTAWIGNRATLALADPEEALLATIGFTAEEDEVVWDKEIEVTQAASATGEFSIENNMTEAVNIDIALDGPAPAGLTVEFSPASLWLNPGQTKDVTVGVTAASGSGLGSHKATVNILGTWTGGSATLAVVVPVTVAEAKEVVPESGPVVAGFTAYGGGVDGGAGGENGAGAGGEEEYGKGDPPHENKGGGGEDDLKNGQDDTGFTPAAAGAGIGDSGPTVPEDQNQE